jgi:hypothetical protein
MKAALCVMVAATIIRISDVAQPPTIITGVICVMVAGNRPAVPILINATLHQTCHRQAAPCDARQHECNFSKRKTTT